MVHYRNNAYGEPTPYYDDTYLISVVLDDKKGVIQQETKEDSIVEARLLAINLIKKAIKAKKITHWAHLLKGNPQQPDDRDSNVLYDNGQFYWIPGDKYGMAVPIASNGKLISGQNALMYWLYFDGKMGGFSNKVIVARGVAEARAIAISKFYRKGREIRFETASFGKRGHVSSRRPGDLFFNSDGTIIWKDKEGKRSHVNPLNGRLN